MEHMARGSGGTAGLTRARSRSGGPELKFTVEPRSLDPATRLEVFAFDHGRCCLQADGFCRGILVPDHFIPWSKGGPTAKTNAWTLCEHHNGRKSARMPNAEEREAWIASGRVLPEALDGVPVEPRAKYQPIFNAPNVPGHSRARNLFTPLQPPQPS